MEIRLPDEEQRRNLRLLTGYLLAGELQAEFNMQNFGEDVNARFSTECGTVGCAVGHGPYAGIHKSSDETWVGYADRVFGTYDIELFLHLFSGKWADHDNSPAGAARRILAVLERIDRGTLTVDYLAENTPFSFC